MGNGVEPEESLIHKFDSREYIYDFCPLMSEHFFQTCVFLAKNLNYFSLGEVFEHCFKNTQIEGSWAWHFTQKSKNLHITTLSCPLPGIEVLTPKGKAQQGIGNVLCLSFKELGWFFSKYHPRLTNFLLSYKIRHSSFFLREILTLQSENNSVLIDRDYFFRNQESFQNFCEFSQQNFSYKEESFENAKIDFFPSLINGTSFVSQAILLTEKDVNADEIEVQKISLKEKERLERIIPVSCETGYSPEETYMFKDLGLTFRTFKTLISERIKEFFLSKKPLDIFLGCDLVEKLENLKIEVKNSLYYLEDKVLFFTFSASDLNRVKKKARKLKIGSFCTFNCSTLEIEMHKISLLLKKRPSYFKC